MQLLLKGGSTGLVDANVNPARDVVITGPVLGAGSVSFSSQIHILQGGPNTFKAEVIYRWWSTDDETSAGSWIASGQSRTGPGKQRAAFTIGSVDGLMFQVGLRITDSVSSSWGEARLEFPVLVTT
jgi:hypothetical protein